MLPQLSPIKTLLCAALLGLLAHSAMAVQPAPPDALFHQNTSFDPDKHPGSGRFVYK